MISKAEITKKSKEWGIRFDIVEKDYCIGWLLKGIAQEPFFKKHLLFKGGTSLRKCYFSDYRFSEDIDFTGFEIQKKENLAFSFEQACRRISDESGCEFTLNGCEEIRTIPNEEAFEAKVSFRGPTQPQVIKPIIKVDVSFYEKIHLPAKTKEIIHPYSDNFYTKVLVYSLEEILAEKLRSILQQKGRVPRPRDYYDAWMLLRLDATEMNLKKVPEAFIKKCQFKNVPFNSVEDFFDPNLLQKNKSAWVASLARQVNALVDFAQLIEELQEKLRRLF